MSARDQQSRNTTKTTRITGQQHSNCDYARLGLLAKALGNLLQFLENHLVYFEEDADGEVSIHIHSWTPELTVYSNIILQIGILFGVMLVFLFVVQKQSELRQNRMLGEEE